MRIPRKEISQKLLKSQTKIAQLESVLFPSRPNQSVGLMLIDELLRKLMFDKTNPKKKKKNYIFGQIVSHDK